MDQSLVGRSFPPTGPYAVTEDAVRAFAEATGAPVRRGAGAGDVPDRAGLRGHERFLEAEQLDLFRIVHGEQRFAYERPVVPGDLLTATLSVASLRQIAGNDIIGTTSEITDADGALVCPTTATARAPGARLMSDAQSPGAEDLHRHPRRPGRLRRGERRPQPDPPGRGGGPQRRAARRDRARHVHHGARGPGGRGLVPGRRGGRPSGASSPPRSSCPPRAASRSRSPARPRSREDGLTTIALTVTSGGQKVLGMPKAVVRAPADG